MEQPESGEPVGHVPADFSQYVEARSPALLRTAWMLTGEAGLAEDLLQTALARTWPHWRRVSQGDPDAYVRKVMLRTNSSWRARFWNREQPASDAFADGLEGPTRDTVGQVDGAHDLASALANLPVRQRQVVVLRFFDDLSVATVAELMGTSEGTVKSQSARGLASLRLALESQDQLESER